MRYMGYVQCTRSREKKSSDLPQYRKRTTVRQKLSQLAHVVRTLHTKISHTMHYVKKTQEIIHHKVQFLLVAWVVCVLLNLQQTVEIFKVCCFSPMVKCRYLLRSINEKSEWGEWRCFLGGQTLSCWTQWPSIVSWYLLSCWFSCSLWQLPPIIFKAG